MKSLIEFSLSKPTAQEKIIMKKLFKLICFIMLCHQTISAAQQPAEKMLFVDSDVDIELLKLQYVGEGFLQGTLVETMKGCVPIEQIEVGDYLVGVEGVQKVLSVKKGKVDLHAMLLMSNHEYVHATMHQDFYLQDRSLHLAAGLGPEYTLLNGMYVVDSEFIHGVCDSYCLTTEHHAFFIYPEMLVHNFNPVIVVTLGSLIIGAVEVSNPVTIVLGIILPLFMTRTTNFMEVFKKQVSINNVHLDQIVKARASWFSNMKITEDFLRARNLLTHQFVEQCKLVGK